MTDRSLLDLLLEPGGIEVVFQPVIEFTADGKRLHHLECLSRGPVGTNLENTTILFDYVRRKREEFLVDVTCINIALQTAVELPPPALPLSLNVHALTLTRENEFVEKFVSFCTAAKIAPSRIILEIMENHMPQERHLFSAVNTLRGLGVRIAFDDFGVQNCNFLSILEVAPDFLKLDRRLIHACHADAERQKILAHLINLSREMNFQIVVKGVEQEAEFHVLRKLGATLMQGFLFAPPMSGEVLHETSFLQDCLG